MQSIVLILLNQALILWIRANFVWRGTNMKFSSFNSHPNKTSAEKQWKMKPRSLECRSYPYTVKRNQSLRMPISHNTPLSTEKQHTRTRLRNEIRVRRIETETAAWYWLVRQSHATGLFLRTATNWWMLLYEMAWQNALRNVFSCWSTSFLDCFIYEWVVVVEFTHPILNATDLAYIEGIYSWVGAQGSNTKWCGKSCCRSVVRAPRVNIEWGLCLF
jgi:hypothetical protein